MGPTKYNNFNCVVVYLSIKVSRIFLYYLATDLNTNLLFFLGNPTSQVLI